jgi:predicted ATPase
MVNGSTAPEVEESYEQARSLCQHVAKVEKRFLVLRGLRVYWGQRGRWPIATELAQEMLRLAQQTQDPIHLLEALRLIGGALFHQGEFNEAYAYFRRAVALYTPQQHGAAPFEYEHEDGVANLCQLGETLWFLGYPDLAQARLNEALALARTLARPFTTLMALDFACDLAQYQCQQQQMQELVAEYSALTAQYPFPHHVMTEMIYQGWLLAQAGDSEAGIDLLTQGLEVWRKSGAVQFLPYYCSWLVEAYGLANQFKQGLALLAATLVLIEETGEQFWQAELHRLSGEFLLAQGAAESEGESCFQQALALARRQGAKSLELRAALSLARLWLRQGKRDAARALLTPIYGWFTEGFNTADLQAANAFLITVA